MWVSWKNECNVKWIKEWIIKQNKSTNTNGWNDDIGDDKGIRKKCYEPNEWENEMRNKKNQTKKLIKEEQANDRNEKNKNKNEEKGAKLLTR